MKIKQLQTELKNEMTKRDFTTELIEKLSNDVNVLMWIEHCIEQKMSKNVAELFDDNGFHEFLEMQYYTPITFDEMTHTDNEHKQNFETVIDSLQKMSEHAQIISDKWNYLPFGYGCELSEEYPFDASFDEIAEKLRQWAEHHKK